jgi:tetratricopeptide (TPR) repeat protein
MFRAHRTLLTACLALAGALGSCAETGEPSGHSVAWNMRHLQFERALELAQAEVAAHPGDPAAAEQLKRAQLAALMERGRRLTLDDQDVEALKVFEVALELDPASTEVGEWIQKTQLKLGDAWLQVAIEQHARGNQAGALDAFEQSLRYHPGYDVALKGMAEVVKEVNHRELLSQKYFAGGVHALSDYWLERASAFFAYSNKYKPKQEHTLERTKQVNLLLAQQRQKIAQAFEEDGLFGAARNEYRVALALAPDDPPSKAALERCTKEVLAQRKLEDANYQIMRGNFERAEKLIEDGLALTLMQKDLFEGARAKIDEQRHEIVYQAALALEKDQRFAEAIEKYQELLGQAGYFKDTLARVDTLKGYIVLADELYKKAGEASDDKTRLDLLQQIRIFWPEYRDAAEQVSELERKLGS